MEMSKVKWVDDMTLMVSLDLASTLVPDTRTDLPRPVPYRGRFELMLPREKNRMQNELDSLIKYTDEHKMKIYHTKTKVMLFSKMKMFDFQPELQLFQTENIEVVEKMKIVGFILRSDLKPISNTTYIVNKAYSRMWVLRRLKGLGATQNRLIDVLQ